ncbi:MAG: fibronectin/fibrinogen-binding protein [Coprobacillus sp.]|nr:fibronectin/fibrinogen-binding protein [Coprobacillus sp.]
MAYDGIMMSRVVEQLSKEMNRGRINKIYQISQYELLIHIRSQSQNKKLLISIHPMYARVQLTHLSYPTPQTPNALTMLLRKHLEGAYLESIEQIQLDRIIDMTFVGTNELKDIVKFHVYIEIMGKHSNVIITYDNQKIIDCLKRISPAMNSQRILQPGAIYQFPPMIDKINPFENEYQENDNLTKIYQGFSPELSREVLYRINNGENFHEIMNQIKLSSSLYLHKYNDKEYFHIIELTHLHCPYQSYDLFDGLDKHFDLIDQKDRIKQQTSDLGKFIQNEYHKNILKLNKLEKTLFDSQNSDEYRIKGDLLFAHLHLIQKGQKEIIVDNYYDNTKMIIELDERYDGKTNAKRYYNKYQKAKNSLHYLHEQIALTKDEITYFDSLMTLMENATYYDALEIKEELENLGYLKKKKTKQLNKKKNKFHIETYLTKDNIKIYVGKNNLQNDYLTFKLASRFDIWFHVKDMPGSHIVVHSENLDEYTIRLASKMAAYFSKGKHSSSVPVNYTQIRTLKKPHNSKPGRVILDHYQTIYIDPDDTFFNEISKID